MATPVHMIRATMYNVTSGITMSPGDSMEFRQWIYSATGSLLEISNPLRGGILVVSLDGVDLLYPEATSVANRMWAERDAAAKEMQLDSRSYDLVRAYRLQVTGTGTGKQASKILSLDADGWIQADTLVTSDISGLDAALAGKQPLDATLTSIAGLTPTTDQMIYFTGTDVAATTTVTSFARTILDDTSSTAVRNTIGAPPTSHASTGTGYGVSSTTNYGHAMASTANPVMDGVASAGTNAAKFAQEGHIHPTDTSRAAVTDLANYVPYTGATTDVALGAFDLGADLLKADRHVYAGYNGTEQSPRFHATALSNGYAEVRLEENGLANPATRIFYFGSAYSTASYRGMFTINHGGSYRYFMAQNGNSHFGTAASDALANTYNVQVAGTINATTALYEAGTAISSKYLSIATAASTYVPYTGATANVDLGTSYGLKANGIEINYNANEINNTAAPLYLNYRGGQAIQMFNQGDGGALSKGQFSFSVNSTSGYTAGHLLDNTAYKISTNSGGRPILLRPGSTDVLLVDDTSITSYKTLAMTANKITGLQAGSASGEAVEYGQLANYIPTSQKAAANGVASLDASTKIPIAQVPTGTTSTTVALGNHLHTGVYEPANANIQSHISSTSNPHSTSIVNLSDTVITSVADNEVLAYDTATSKWINQTASEAGLATATHTQAVNRGGTNITSYAVGDMIYASATTTLAKVSPNTTTVKQYLSMTGTGAAGAMPLWSAIASADISDLSTTLSAYLTTASAASTYVPYTGATSNVNLNTRWLVMVPATDQTYTIYGNDDGDGLGSLRIMGNDSGSSLSNTDIAAFGTTAITLEKNVRANGRLTVAGRTETAASTASAAGLTIPNGTAPSSPTTGDCWGTSSTLYYRAGSITRAMSYITGWVAPDSYASGISANADPVRVTLHSDGSSSIVHLRGGATGPTSGTYATLCTLPSSYRPSVIRYVHGTVNNVGGINVVMLKINTNGTVQRADGGNFNYTWYLDGISYSL